MTLQVALEALNTEAGKWDEVSADLTSAAYTASFLILTSASFSALASTTGVDTSYTDAKDFVVDVLEAGATETSKLADALRQVRTDYESTDGAVRNAVEALWQPQV